VLAVRVLAHEAVHVLKGHPAAHHVCGVAARLSGEWQEAAARFRHSTHLAPTVEAGWLELTWALAMLRDLDGALTAAQSALEHGDSAAGWSNLAAVRMERGEKDQARSALDKALAKGPQDWKLRTLDEQWRRRWPAT
jgi:tetratricopeptide (TPR) repeat protein